MVYEFNGMVLSDRNGGNSAIYNRDGPRGHSAKWKKSDKGR